MHWQHGYVESGTKSLVWSFSSFAAAAAAAFCVPFWFVREKAQNKKKKIFFLLQNLGRGKKPKENLLSIAKLGKKKELKEDWSSFYHKLGKEKKAEEGKIIFLLQNLGRKNYEDFYCFWLADVIGCWSSWKLASFQKIFSAITRDCRVKLVSQWHGFELSSSHHDCD